MTNHSTLMLCYELINIIFFTTGVFIFFLFAAMSNILIKTFFLLSLLVSLCPCDASFSPAGSPTNVPSVRMSPVLRRHENEVFQPLFDLTFDEIEDYVAHNPKIVFACNERKETLLHITYNIRLAEIALKAGADVNALDCKGKTPLDKVLSVVTHYSTPSSPSQLSRRSLIDLFIAHGAHVVIPIMCGEEELSAYKKVVFDAVEACIVYHSIRSTSFDYSPIVEDILLANPTLRVPSFDDFIKKIGSMAKILDETKIHSIIE